MIIAWKKHNERHLKEWNILQTGPKCNDSEYFKCGMGMNNFGLNCICKLSCYFLWKGISDFCTSVSEKAIIIYICAPSSFFFSGLCQDQMWKNCDYQNFLIGVWWFWWKQMVIIKIFVDWLIKWMKVDWVIDFILDKSATALISKLNYTLSNPFLKVNYLFSS